MKDVQAIILAGGLGTRLCPLTETVPKPKLRILGKSVLDLVLSRLKNAGIENITITTRYKHELIETSGNGICFVREENALGTAGAVKNAYDGKSTTVLVLSGDGVFDFEISEAIRFHNTRRPDVTLVTAKSENPPEYGVVNCDDDGRITSFCEKPPWQRVKSGRVNTGIYVLNPSVLDCVPKGKAFDFSKQLFPLLMSENKTLCSFDAHGFWCDIGCLDEYFSCNASALENKIDGVENDGLTELDLSGLGVEIISPVYVSDSAKIGRNVKLGPFTVVGKNVTIGDEATLEEAILFDNVKLGKGCGIYGAIVGEDTEIGENCVVPEGCAIGGKSQIGDGVMLKKYTHLHSETVLSEGKNMFLSFKNKQGGLFGENGIFCGDGELSQDYFVKLGYSMGLVLLSIKHEKNEVPRIAVMTDFGIYPILSASALCVGIRSSGVHVYDLGKGYESLCRFAAVNFIADVCIFVHRGKDNTTMKLFNSYGVPVSDSFERSLEKMFFSDPEYLRPENIYETQRLDALGTLYYGELVKSVRKNAGEKLLSDFECFVNSEGVPSDISPSNLLISAICELGGRVSEKGSSDIPTFFVSPDGTNVYAEQGRDRADFSHIGAILIANASQEGQTRIVLPYTAPEAFRVAAKRNRLVTSDFSTSDGNVSDATRSDMYSEMWLYDGLFAALKLCILMQKSKKSLGELLEDVPEFCTYSDELVGNKSKADVMEKLSRLDNSDSRTERDGIRLTLADGTVTVIPSRSAGLKIISEAANAETARELCRRIEEIIKE